MSRVFLPLQAFNKPTPVRCLSCGHKWVAQPGDTTRCPQCNKGSIAY